MRLITKILVMGTVTTLMISLLANDVTAAPTPVQIVYTGEDGCACPTQLDYQLNVPKPSKPKKNYGGGEYEYRVKKPVQTKTKISYNFDLTVEQPRTPAPSKKKPRKLFAKVDRVVVQKSDCQADHKTSCSCSSCSAANQRYVAKLPSSSPITSINVNANSNVIRHRRDLNSNGSIVRIMRQHNMKDFKYYNRNLCAQQQQKNKMRLFGLRLTSPSKFKQKNKRAPLSSKYGKHWSGLGIDRRKRDIKGEYDLLEQEHAKMDITAPEIIQFMPETLSASFKRDQCHMGCGGNTANSSPKTSKDVSSIEQSESEQSESPSLLNSVPIKRAALNYCPDQIPSPLSGSYNEYKFVDDSQLRNLLSTTSVPDPSEQNSTPLQFAGDLESVNRRSYSTPVLGIGVGYPVEHVDDTQLDTIISGIMYQHPDYVNTNSDYSGSLVDPEPVQKKQTTDFLKKLIDGRLGGWGFDTALNVPESDGTTDYSTRPAKTYGYNSHTHDGYSVDTYNVPPITDYLRAWF